MVSLVLPIPAYVSRRLRHLHLFSRWLMGSSLLVMLIMVYGLALFDALKGPDSR